MNDAARIREQIQRMRSKGVEPEIVYMCDDLWQTLGQPCKFANVCCMESDQILGRFEVR